MQTLGTAYTQQLSEVIDDHLGDVFPAIAMAVIYRGDWLIREARGWIDPETRQNPIQLDARFDLASVTKLFTETTFLSLVSEGLIRLEDALVEVIPEFGNINPRTMDGGQDPHSKELLPIPNEVENKTVDPTKVTFWHLITHTSGLAPWRDVYRHVGDPPTSPDTPDLILPTERWARGLAYICQTPFVGYPEEKIVRYSDLGLMLLGEAAARLYGKPLDEAIDEHVLQPLDLKTIGFNPVRQGIDRNIILPTEGDPYWRKRRVWGEVHDENACGIGGIAGHAGLFGAVEDIARFGQAWLERDSRLNIKTQLLDTATQFQAAGNFRVGLGWLMKAKRDSSAGDLFSERAYGHTGFTGTSLWIDPKRELVVVCLTNRVYPGREKEGIHPFRRKLHTIIAQGVDSL